MLDSTRGVPDTVALIIESCTLPHEALLHRYVVHGGFTDCFCITIDRPIDQASYIQAFYTTCLFKIERGLLAAFVERPSTDEQARALAAGERDEFSAWTVEARQTDQVLMCDISGRTRSWLMSTTSANNQTRLFFGSAIVPVVDKRSGQRHLGFPFQQLLGFHTLYSRALLQAAAQSLARTAT